MMKDIDSTRYYTNKVTEEWVRLALSAENRTFFEDNYIGNVITDLKKIDSEQEELARLVKMAESITMGE